MDERLKELRKSLGLTQQEFADRLNIKRNTVATYEAGNSNPSSAAVELICKTFSVNPDWLKSGTGEMFQEKDFELELMEWAGRSLSGSSTAFKKAFAAMLMRLSDDEWLLIEKKLNEIMEYKKNLENEKEPD